MENKIYRKQDGIDGEQMINGEKVLRIEKNAFNILLITFSFFLLLSCSTKNSNAENENILSGSENLVTLTNDQLKNAGIETGLLSTKKISSVLKLNGKIDVPPQNLVSISVPLGGYLKFTQLLPGMVIKKGDVLAVMEDVQYIQLQQDYLSSKAQFELYESEYNRQKNLNQTKATSDKNFELAKANFQSQLILIKSLEAKLKLIGLNPQKVIANNISKSINVYSSINGFVSAVNVNIGKYVNPTDVLFELVNPDDIHLALTVFEKDINKLSIGQKIWAYSNANPNKKYSGEIILISRSLSPQNATEVHCHFDRYDNSLLPGMFMNADVEITGVETQALPEDAFVRFENKNYVFISKENRQFEMTEVQIGDSENGFIPVTNPEIIKGKKLVLKGAYNLLMALKNSAEE